MILRCKKKKNQLNRNIKFYCFKNLRIRWECCWEDRVQIHQCLTNFMLFFNDFNNTGEKYDFKSEIKWVSSISSYNIGNTVLFEYRK